MMLNGRGEPVNTIVHAILQARINHLPACQKPFIAAHCRCKIALWDFPG